MFTIAFIVNRPFFSKYHSLSTHYHVTLATKTYLSHLLYPTIFWLYIRLNSFFDNGFSTKFQHLRVRPASGFRNATDDKINEANNFGDYWSADPKDYNNGCVMGFSYDKVYPLFVNIRTFGFAVRPAAEK